MINVIVAMDENGLIGNGDGLPWVNSEEMQHFKKTTLGHSVIMGHNTLFKTLRGKFLPGRSNYLVSTDATPASKFGGSLFHNIQKSLREHPNREIFVIGGRSVFAEALEFADRVYLSIMAGEFSGDVYFPWDKYKMFEEYKYSLEYEFRESYSFSLLSRFPR